MRFIQGLGAIGLEFTIVLLCFPVCVYFSSSQRASEWGTIKIIYSDTSCLPILYYDLFLVFSNKFKTKF